MRVQVDETRSNDMPSRVNGFLASDLGAGNVKNLAVSDTDIAHGVEPAFRIHDPAIQDDEIIVLRLR
jgi:hypothetical protein